MPVNSQPRQSYAPATALHANGAVPDWVQLLPLTPFTGRDGRGPYMGSLDDVAARSELPFAVDEAHGIDQPWQGNTRAHGWVVELQVRADGLWGRVEWTESGRDLVQSKAYRFSSPVFTHSDQLVIGEVLRLALVNNPNLRLASLNRQQDD
ncbi:MAG: hypothetical protein EAZ99_19870, partial [Alphaproteobacteria bacterium]